jgi:hypothetical protein
MLFAVASVLFLAIYSHEKPWETAMNDLIFNPKGIVAQSPTLRGTRYVG